MIIVWCIITKTLHVLSQELFVAGLHVRSTGLPVQLRKGQTELWLLPSLKLLEYLQELVFSLRCRMCRTASLTVKTARFAWVNAALVVCGVCRKPMICVKAFGQTCLSACLHPCLQACPCTNRLQSSCLKTSNCMRMPHKWTPTYRTNMPTLLHAKVCCEWAQCLNGAGASDFEVYFSSFLQTSKQIDFK